jgi:SpoVK/Ycf46/Vps4 family AAA+-type ATPase
MARKSFRNRFTASADVELEPIVRLWLLRLVVPLECHRKLIIDSGYDNDEIALLLDLPGVDSETEFDAVAARKQLQKMHELAEEKADQLMLPQPLQDNIQKLAPLVGLNDVECQLLGFANLLNQHRLLNDASDWLGTELSMLKLSHVLAVLLNVSSDAVQDALASRSVFAQTALLTIDRDYTNVLSRKLVMLSDGFAYRLMSESSSPLDWLRDMIIRSAAPHLTLDDFPHIKTQLDFLLPYLQQAVNEKRQGVNVFLYGTPGTGKTQLTRLLAQQLDCPLYEVASEDDDGDPTNGEQRLSALRAGQAFFKNTSALLLFDEVEDVFNDGDNLFGPKSTAQTRKAWMNRLLEENTVPTFWLGNSIYSVDPAFIRRFDWVIELPVPPKAQRERIIRESCGGVLTDQAIQRLAACEELAPAVVTRSAQVISRLQNQFSTEQLSSALQQMMNKTLIAQGHAGLNQDDAQRLPDGYDPELVNCDVDLLQIAAGIRQHGSARICLFGPPGTGKSAYSRWLSEQLDKPLHIKRGADLFSKWVGGTEKNIARVFQEAKEDNAVLLIDEVDSFLQDRNRSQHSWEITGVNEMLTRMEAYNGVFIASTNRLEGMDSAALRRFDLKVKFDALKPQQAWKLLQIYCHSLGLPEPDTAWQTALHKLDGLTPGDFAVLARQHKFRPISDVKTMIESLAAECALKEPYRKQSIGFI